MEKNYFRKIIFTLYKTTFNTEYSNIIKINTKDRLKELQEKLLIKILHHCYYNVPYYNRIFKKIGLIKNNNIDLLKFDKIPILSLGFLRLLEKQLNI